MNEQLPQADNPEYFGKEREYLETYKSQFLHLYSAINRIDDFFDQDNPFSFDRPGFFKELITAEDALLKERFPNGVAQEDGSMDRAVESDLDSRWAMGGPGSFSEFLVTLDLYHHLEKKKLLGQKDKELMFRSFPQFYIGHYYIGRGRDSGVYQKHSVIFNEQRKHLLEFIERSNINEIDEAIKERQCFMQAYQAFFDEKILRIRREVDESLFDLSPEAIERARACAECAVEDRNASLFSGRWGHDLFKATSEIRTTQEMLSFLNEIKKLPIKE